MKKFCTGHRKFETRTLEDKLYLCGWMLAPVLLVLCMCFSAMESDSAPGCIFYRLFGAYCPGCGGTRAIKAFCSGRVLTALWYHPLVPYAVIVYLLFMISHTWERLKLPYIKGMKYRDLYAYVAIGILVVNFVLKNILVIFFKIYM